MLVIGLMSGTSLDGVDAALVETDGEMFFKQISNHHLPYSLEFQNRLRLMLNDWANWLVVEKELTLYHNECIVQLLEKTNTSKDDINVIGFHGQTIYHNTQEGLTWQFGNPHLLARLTGINVVSDFRRRDVAYGGQGAPLVPIFHKCLCSNDVKPVAILNIGGVANITYIDENDLIAFDTGPGNALINDLMLKYFNKSFDESGEIANEGKVHQKFIENILKNDYFSKKPPKSLDRNEFIQILELISHLDIKDMIATITRLTVDSIILSIKMLPKLPMKIYICGGGYKNKTIIKWLENSQLTEFKSINELKYDPDFIEAQAFAYLAVRFIKKLPSSFPSTTGVSKETVCGILFEK